MDVKSRLFKLNFYFYNFSETKLRISKRKGYQSKSRNQSFNKKVFLHQQKEIIKSLNFNSKKMKRKKNHNFKQA